MRRTLALVLAGAALATVVPLAEPARAAADSVAGVPADQVGLNGPVANHLENLRLVAHAPIVPEGETRALGNHGAVALIGDCAYVGRWHDYTGDHGVQILDVSRVDEGIVPLVGRIPQTARVGGVARELRAVDLPGFKLLVVMIFSNSLGDRRNNMLQLYTIPDGGSCTEPALAGTFEMAAVRGHEFYLWVDPNREHDVDGHPRVLAFLTVPPGPPSLLVVDVSRPTLPVLVGTYEAGLPVLSESDVLGKYAHSVSVSPDGTEAYLSYWDGGFLTVDTSMIAEGGAGTALPKGAMTVPYSTEPPGNTHSAVKLPDSDLAVVGDEIYATAGGGCPYGWMRIVDVGGLDELPRQIGEYRLDENRPETCSSTTESIAKRNAAGLEIFGTFSMHNQTVVGRTVLASWYGGGMRVVDVTDPTAPVEAGAFVPAPLPDKPLSTPSTSAPVYGEREHHWRVAVWSYPVIRDGLIYVTDVRNGLYVLAPTDDAPFADAIAGTVFAEGNSNLGDILARE